MASSLATQAKLGVFEGDSFKKVRPLGGYEQAFVWDVEEDRITMSTFYGGTPCTARRFALTPDELKTLWTLNVPNPAMRMRAAEALRG